jgi:hypothetical protein
MTQVQRAIAGLVALFAAPDARADTCGPAAGLDHVLPVDGTADVDRSALIVVRHSLVDAPLDGAPAVTLRDAGGAEVETAASWDGREVTLLPSSPLGPSSSYSVVAERSGREAHSFAFTTGDDAGGPASPELGPSLGASFEYLGGGPEGDDPCGPIGFERYRVHLELPAAQGTSGPENIAYVVFETRGRGVTEPTEVARAVDETGGDEVGIDLYVPANGVSGRACFRILAVDVTGPPSGTTDEACVRLEEGPFFSSICGVARAPGAPRRAGAPGLLLLAFAAALTLRRRVSVPGSAEDA